MYDVSSHNSLIFALKYPINVVGLLDKVSKYQSNTLINLKLNPIPASHQRGTASGQ
jgi:hypothetical protein